MLGALLPRAPLALLVAGVAEAAPLVRHEEPGRLAVDVAADGSFAQQASVHLLQSAFAHQRESAGPESEHLEAFLSFISEHGRPYKRGTALFEERLAHFARSAAAVREQNGRPDRRWDATINSFSDWSPEELKQLRGWRGGIARTSGPLPAALGQGEAIVEHHKKLPQEFKNWTRLSAATDIQDQGGCGSCWAVTSATVLRAHAEIYRSARSFSAQELVNCVQNPLKCGGKGGCQGATAELAFHYVAQNGLGTEEAHPYQGSDGTCRKTVHMLAQGVGNSDLSLQERMDKIASPGVHTLALASVGSSLGMRAWERLPENQYAPLLRAIVERGPVAVSVAAEGWNSYASGVYDSCKENAVIDHAVTLLGYGHHRGKKFWIVQNSWGPNWGMSGHIHLLRGESDNFHCGTDHQPELGTGCKGGPASVRVCGMCGIHYDSVVPHFKRG